MDFLSNMDVIFGLLGTLFGVLSFFYYRKIRFYMFVSKILKFNKTTKINVKYLFTTPKTLDLKSIKKSLGNDKFKIMNGNKNNVILEMDDFIIHFHKDDFPEDDFGNNASITMNVTKTYYKQAKKSIDKFISICECFESNMEMSDKKFNLSIDYTSVKNPYLSPSVHRIDEEYIKNLILKVNTSFLINDLDEEVIITKNKLSYTTKNSKNLYQIANEFMVI